MLRITAVLVVALAAAAPAAAQETPPPEGPSSETPAPSPAVTTEPSPPAQLEPPAELPVPASLQGQPQETSAEEPPTSEGGEEPSTSEALPPPTGQRLLVMSLIDSGGGPNEVAAINAAVQQQATRSHIGEVVTQEQLRVTLDANALQAMAGCDSENCLADFGRRVDAHVVLGGNVARVGDDLIITILAIEPGTGKSVGQEQRKVSAVYQDLYYYAARQLTALVLTGRTVDPTVPVRIDANLPGAEVLVDGRSVGQVPLTVPLDPGAHAITVKLEDHVPWEARVNVEEGTPLTVSATLEEAGGFPLWPIALGFVGGGLLTGGTSAIMSLLALEQTYPQVSYGPVPWPLPILGLIPTGNTTFFNSQKDAYYAPGRNTGDLSAQKNFILLLWAVSDISLVMTAFFFVVASALVVTDVVLWSLEE